MNLSKVKVGNYVKCNVRGRVFTAEVVGKDDGGLVISPLQKGISYYRVQARQVVEVVRPGVVHEGG